MQSEIQQGKNGKVNLFVSGQAPIMGIDFPEAIRRIDQAYTEDFAELAGQIENHILAMRASAAQLLRVIDTLEKVLHTIRTRHLGQTD